MLAGAEWVVFGSFAGLAILILTAVRYELNLPTRIALVIAIPAFGLVIGSAAGLSITLNVTWSETVIGLAGALWLSSLSYQTMTAP